MEKEKDDILTIDSLEIGYVSGKHVNVLLSPLSASALKGELIALIGRNGIGKSTLLKTITGLQTSFGGEILYGGKRISDYSRMGLAQKVGYISTEIVKVINMSVYDLVALGRYPHTNWLGKIDSKNHEIIMDSIEKTGLSSLRNRFVSELSDGERQRAMIARIFAQDTSIMVMDEPTAFLDIGAKYEILHLMHTLSHDNDKTIIFSTHDLQMAISQSDKIWLIINNNLIEGAPEDLMIKGAFDHIFDDSNLQFNPEQGTFKFMSESKGDIFVSGDGFLRHWTEKAIIRAGFSVSSKKTIPYITVPSESNKKWRLSKNEADCEFVSLYELIRYLSQKESCSS